MVSLWPFGGQDNSPGAFEKKLSSLATQIIDHEKRLNQLRTRGRRLKALWTIYTIITWVVYAIILVLVVGLENANMYQIAGLGVSPFVVYLVRQIIKRYYEWRVLSVETSLESLRDQQRETIEKLKAATKYDSTQALLDKYTKTATTTGAQPVPPPIPHGKDRPKQEGPGSQPGTQPGTPTGSLRKRGPQAPQLPRANAAGPPPKQDPNQPRPSGPPGPIPDEMSMQLPPDFPRNIPPHMMAGMPPGMMPPVTQFAPPPPEEPREPQWYDRFLDVLLGEDEMSAKNRFALICSYCRQVNGLAPPGTTNVEDIRYICGRCGAENGKPEVSELIGKVAEDQAAAEQGASHVSKSKPRAKGKRKDKVVYEEEAEDDGAEEGAEEDLQESSSSEETVVVKKRKGKSNRRKA